MTEEIIVDNSNEVPSKLEQQLITRIREEVQPDGQELAIQMLQKALAGDLLGVEELINARIQEIMGG